MQRSRSNALHADSLQQFILIAEYSHQKPGYYYNDKIRKEVENKIKTQHNVSLPAPTTPNESLFQNFNFTQMDQQWKEQNQEIKMKSNRKQLNFAIIISEIERMRMIIYGLFDKEDILNYNQDIKPQQNLDIVIVKTQDHGQENVIKFWIIKEAAAQDLLFEIYLKRAHRILRLCLSPEETTIRCGFLCIDQAEDIIKGTIVDFFV